LAELQDEDPRQIGKYTLLSRLGSGGMGDVFLGRSLGGRLVAVKVIRPDLARDRNFRARFAREVEAARRVSGVFTAPVVDADPDAVVPWLVTAYVRGPSLADAVEQYGSLPLAALFSLAAGLAEGLAAVHEAGIIHRDLKPSNVLLANDGPRLIDFGISQAADFSQVTQTGMVIGTLGFMSPEQLLGGEIGPVSDVFSLGAVLVFAATGEGPYGTGSPAVRQYRVLNSAPRLDKLPGELQPFVAQCMASEPADRPTASQFLAGLVAAHPAAANQAGWLTEVTLAGAVPVSSAPPPIPSAPPPILSATGTSVVPPAGWESTTTRSASPLEGAVTRSPSWSQPRFVPKKPLPPLPSPAPPATNARSGPPLPPTGPKASRAERKQARVERRQAREEREQAQARLLLPPVDPKASRSGPPLPPPR
jgi:eukaryotic-like serine/threonine-protein kinase